MCTHYWVVLGNWEAIVEELCISNVIQRDCVIFAAKLHPCLSDVAAQNEKVVSSPQILDISCLE